MDAREEAARWFTVLHRKVMTLEERAAYERWVCDDANRAVMAEMQRVWTLLEVPRHTITDAVAQQRHPRGTLHKILVAAACVILISVGTLSFSHTAFWTSLDWTDR